MNSPAVRRRNTGFLTEQQRQAREKWRAAVNSKDARGLEQLGFTTHSEEGAALLAGCASAWAVKESQEAGWGRGPSIAWLRGFADALCTAQTVRERRAVWRAWPAVVEVNRSLPRLWSQLWLTLSKVDEWVPEEGRLLFKPPGLLESLQSPHRFTLDKKPDIANLTPLQMAWMSKKPVLCSILIANGASPDEVFPESSWPLWSLKRALEGDALESIHPGMDVDVRLELDWAHAANTASMNKRDPDWVALATELRHRALDERLPKAVAGKKGPRF
jgi:hypothetical protein